MIPYITGNEIIEVAKSLKNSSPDWDSIPANIAKPSIEYYIKPLTRLVNSSFQNGIFPDELKMAKVIPIFKSGDKANITNYRPIFVLPFFSKIFRFDKHNILYKYQFGFCKSHSTNHAIILLVDKINNALDSGNVLIGVFLDLKKAFDTVTTK